MQSRTVESGVQFFSRMTSQNLENLSGINNKLFLDGEPRGNQVIEINFHDDVDPTDFIIDIIVRAILPSKYSSEFKEVQVILLNTDFQINLFKIIKFIEKKLEPYNVGNEKKVVIEQALKNLTFLNCFSLEQLEITFYSLESIINTHKNPGLVILDNIVSQYWCAKFNNFMLSFEEYSLNILDQLYNKIKHLNIILMYGRVGVKVNKTRVSQIVSYSIEIIQNNEAYLANVTNFEKDNFVPVPFKVDICPEFF